MLEIEDDLGNDFNVNPEEENELEDIIEVNINDNINSNLESEQKINEEDTIKNCENIEKENNIKNYIEELGKNFTVFDEDKMD
jgi:hypothetical protein